MTIHKEDMIRFFNENYKQDSFSMPPGEDTDRYLDAKIEARFQADECLAPYGEELSQDEDTGEYVIRKIK